MQIEQQGTNFDFSLQTFHFNIGLIKRKPLALVVVYMPLFYQYMQLREKQIIHIDEFLKFCRQTDIQINY